MIWLVGLVDEANTEVTELQHKRRWAMQRSNRTQ